MRIIFLSVTLAVVSIVQGTAVDGDEWVEATGLSAPYNPSAVSTGGSATGGNSLGSVMKHTLENYATMPLTTSAAEAEGMTKVGNCIPKLGVLYEPAGGTSKEAPLAAYYTPGGQLTGLRVTIWGSGSNELGIFQGPAASASLVDQGYWIKSGEHEWQMSVSFRDPSLVCSSEHVSDEIGDRIILNQHTIAKSIPMTRSEAMREKFAVGSCMKGMGQHWFYDVATAPSISFQSSTLLPVTPMYDVANGKINAFFFSTPSCQNGEGPRWDNAGPLGAGLPSAGMCANFCDEKCATSTKQVGIDKIFKTSSWSNPKTTCWATMHIFFNEHPDKSPTCPNAISMFSDPLLGHFGRSCGMHSKSNGEHCNDDDECSDGQCTCNRCGRKQSSGAVCAKDDNCSSGDCEGWITVGCRGKCK
jgi:WAS/WASL-interacting protein